MCTAGCSGWAAASARGWRRANCQRTIRRAVRSFALADPTFYRLDTCFSPLPCGAVMYYPTAFTTEGLALIHARTAPEQRIALSRDDAVCFAANAVTFGRTILLSSCSQTLRAELIQGAGLHGGGDAAHNFSPQRWLSLLPDAAAGIPVGRGYARGACRESCAQKVRDQGAFHRTTMASPGLLRDPFLERRRMSAHDPKRILVPPSVLDLECLASRGERIGQHALLSFIARAIRAGGDACRASGSPSSAIVDAGGWALLPGRPECRLHHCRFPVDAVPLHSQHSAGTRSLRGCAQHRGSERRHQRRWRVRLGRVAHRPLDCLSERSLASMSVFLEMLALAWVQARTFSLAVLTAPSRFSRFRFKARSH